MAVYVPPSLRDVHDLDKKADDLKAALHRLDLAEQQRKTNRLKPANFYKAVAAEVEAENAVANCLSGLTDQQADDLTDFVTAQGILIA